VIRTGWILIDSAFVPQIGYPLLLFLFYCVSKRRIHTKKE
jgi:hypothetical protein